jgi:hypothetical protein
MKIVIREQSQYGCIVFYPVCQEAKLLARIAGTKTLTPRILALVSEGGHTVAELIKGGAEIAWSA